MTSATPSYDSFRTKPITQLKAFLSMWSILRVLNQIQWEISLLFIIHVHASTNDLMAESITVQTVPFAS